MSEISSWEGSAALDGRLSFPEWTANTTEHHCCMKETWYHPAVSAYVPGIVWAWGSVDTYLSGFVVCNAGARSRA